MFCSRKLHGKSLLIDEFVSIFFQEVRTNFSYTKNFNHFALLFCQFKCSFEKSVAVLTAFHCLRVRNISKTFRCFPVNLLKAIEKFFGNELV